MPNVPRPVCLVWHWGPIHTMVSGPSLDLCNAGAVHHFMATVHCGSAVTGVPTWLSSGLHYLHRWSEVPRFESRAGPRAPGKSHCSSSYAENGVDLGILERFLVLLSLLFNFFFIADDLERPRKPPVNNYCYWEAAGPFRMGPGRRKWSHWGSWL